MPLGIRNLLVDLVEWAERFNAIDFKRDSKRFLPVFFKFQNVADARNFMEAVSEEHCDIYLTELSGFTVKCSR